MAAELGLLLWLFYVGLIMDFANSYQQKRWGHALQNYALQKKILALAVKGERWAIANRALDSIVQLEKEYPQLKD